MHIIKLTIAFIKSAEHPSHISLNAHAISPAGEILSYHFLNGVHLHLGKIRSYHLLNGSLPSFLYIEIEL
jgi:hypothetical protein